MIYIDFQGGAHGNYLEFVCNRFLAKVPVNKPTPFSSAGASHEKQYLADPVFRSGHYSLCPDLYAYYDPSGTIISIQIQQDDLLPLNSVSLLRAGDFNLDNDLLEIDTYNKLNNDSYRWMLDNIIAGFFQDQIRDSYDAVRGEDWPDVNDQEDFDALPQWIREECISVHGLQLLRLSKEFPDCPRHILREFFKIGFKFPEQHGFITLQQQMVYQSVPLIFPFGSFYQIDSFVTEVKRLAQALNYSLDDEQGLISLHREFLDRQPYKYSKNYCDELVERIIDGPDFGIPDLDLLQESYILACLESHYHKEYVQSQWFENSRSMKEYFQHVG